MAYIGKSPTGSGVRTRYYYTATGGETSLSGADDNGKTLTFSDGEYMDVYLNGVLLVHGTDYGTGTANTISSLAALAGGDIAEVIVYDVYNIADVNRKALRTRYYKTAAGGETSISGTDDSGATITFAANAQIEVKLNGVSLVQGTDYNTTSANTVGGLSALTAGQVVEIVKYERFVLGDTVSKADGGTFSNSIGITDDLTVDTNTLHVDSTNNRVGVGTASPTTPLEVSGSGTIARLTGTGTNVYLRLGNTTDTGGYIAYDGTDLQLWSQSAKRITVDSDGLKFGSDTAAANALDDYEEGTWTASYGSSGSNTGNYRKIGNLVFAQVTINNTSQTFSVITGLPFTGSANNVGGIVGRIIGFSGFDRSNLGCEYASSQINLLNSTGGAATVSSSTGTTRLDLTVIYPTS